MSRATFESTAEKIIILCSTINILPSFAESRQIEVLAWKLFARVAMRTAMAQTDKSICLFAMRLLLFRKNLPIFARH